MPQVYDLWGWRHPVLSLLICLFAQLNWHTYPATTQANNTWL
jgi:hypothetical protein